VPFFHGSAVSLPVGTQLTARPNGYVHTTPNQRLERLFEAAKPPGALSRRGCVFLTDNLDDIDNVGGATDYLYEVSTTFPVQRSDLSFYTLADMQLEAGELENAQHSAARYWAGDTHEGVFEYRVKHATIIAAID
jgi:hypothetical protein